MEKIKNCASCKYYAAEISNLKNGNCHRNPPTSIIMQTTQGPQPASFFPPTQATHWCGEHSYKFAMQMKLNGTTVEGVESP